MRYIASCIQSNRSLHGEKEISFCHVYADDTSKLDAIKDVLFAETLEFIQSLPAAPEYVIIREGFSLSKNVYCYLKIHMKVLSNFHVCAYAVCLKDFEYLPQIDPFPCPTEHFQPKIHTDWNIICEDVHYTNDTFANVYRDFLRGIEPPEAPIDTGIEYSQN